MSAPAAVRAAASASHWRPAALVAAWAIGLSLLATELVVLIGWACDQGQASAVDALRSGLFLWLAAHHSGLVLRGVHIGVTPYGLTALPLFLLVRFSTRALDECGVGGARPVLRFAGMTAGFYATTTVLLCLLGSTKGAHADPSQALGGGAVLAMSGVLLAALRRPAWKPALSDRVATVLRGTGVALCTLLICGCVLAALAIGWHHAAVTRTGDAVGPSVAGTSGLGLLDLLAAPTAVVDGASVLAGPGFAVGAQTHVSLGGISLGAVPGLPLLGALPDSGTYPGAVFVLLVIPVIAGGLAGWRATQGVRGLKELLVRSTGIGAASGLAFASLAALVGGAAGPGRLAVTGPSPWRTGLAVAAEIGCGAVAVALVRAVRQRRSD